MSKSGREHLHSVLQRGDFTSRNDAATVSSNSKRIGSAAQGAVDVGYVQPDVFHQVGGAQKHRNSGYKEATVTQNQAVRQANHLQRSCVTQAAVDGPVMIASGATW